MLHFDSTPVANQAAPKIDIAVAADVGRLKYQPTPAMAPPVSSRRNLSTLPTFLSNDSVASFLISMPNLSSRYHGGSSPRTDNVMHGGLTR